MTDPDDPITVFTSIFYNRNSTPIQQLIDLAKQELNLPTYDNVSDDPNYQVSYTGNVSAIGGGPSDGLRGDAQSTMSQFTNLDEDLPDSLKNETTSPMNTGGYSR